MPTSERPLLARIVDGDAEATAWLFDRFAPRLQQRLAMRYRELDAEELLQDAFLVCFQDGAAVLRRALDRLPPGETAEHRVALCLWDQACGLATTQRRLQLRRAAVVPIQEFQRAGEADPERESLARDTLRRLSRCLSARDRRAYLYFKLRYVDGLKPAEISLSTGWTRKLTYRLKQELEEAVRVCAKRLEIDVR